MKRDSLKVAADSLTRLEGLQKALDNLRDVPHETFPIRFFSPSYSGVDVFYPRADYVAVLEDFIATEEQRLSDLGVEL